MHRGADSAACALWGCPAPLSIGSVMAPAEWMRTSGQRRSSQKRAELLPSDSARVVARHVRQSVGVVGRARGRRRARLTARHGRGVRALTLRAFPSDGRVQRGAAGATQPAAACTAAGSVLGVPAAGTPLCGGGARAAAAVRATSGSCASGAICASAAGTAAASAAGILWAGVQATATGAAKVLRTSMPRRYRRLAAAVPLRGIRGCGGRSKAGLHAATTTTTCTAATLRATGATLLRTGSPTTAATTWLVST